MLEELDIKNFALIDSAHVEFNKGFTVLSGETGAGKSILIGSVAFLLGGKASVDQIRSGCHEAIVSGTFLLKNKEAFEWLEERSIETEDDRILVRRVVKDTGKSSSWIGGVPVTRADLADFGSYLIDIHGQHEQQSLMKVSDHRRYLDIYANLVDEVNSFKELYTKLVEKRHLLDSLNTNESERENRLEMLNFTVNEITNANLKLNEDDELEAEENRLASFEKLYSDVEELCSIFEGDGGSVVSLLKRSTSTASHASSLDKNLEELENRLQSSYYELDDIAKEYSHYKNSLVFDPERLQEVQDRLEVIYKLKKKYLGLQGGSIKDLLDYSEKCAQEAEQLGSFTQDKSALTKEIETLEKEAYTKAKEISGKRKIASDKMSVEVENVLKKLGMASTKFSVCLKEKEGNDVEQKCGPYGMDDIEFLISANPGSPLLPLTRIASGGELSRVMLSLKTILSDADTMDTLVFDEIDTGIGGEVAVSLGEHMKALASKKQILCITHLASIAVYADNQIKIQKGVEGNSTQTRVFQIEGEDRVKEIARMLSGDSETPESLEHAASMLKKFGGV